MLFNLKNIKSRLLASGILFVLGLFLIIVVHPSLISPSSWQGEKWWEFFWQKENVRPVRAAYSHNVYGWGWSEGIGWISMNCYSDYDNDGKFECCCPGGAGGANCPANAESCPYTLTCSSGSDNKGDTCLSDNDCLNGYCSGDYGVNADKTSNYKVSGYAWAGSHAGWVCFGGTCSGVPPDGRPKSWACVGKESWNGGEFTCDGDKGEGFRNTANLKGHWQMNELGSKTGGCAEQPDCVPDQTNLHPGFLKPSSTAGPRQAIGKYGYALQFDGEDDYIEVAGVSFTNSFTIEVWVKRGSIGTGTTGAQTILGKWDESNNERSYRLWFDNNNRLNFSVSSDGTSASIASVVQKSVCVSGTKGEQNFECATDTDCPGVCVRADNNGTPCTENATCTGDDGVCDMGQCKNPPITDMKKWHHLAAKHVIIANTPYLWLFIDGWRVETTPSGVAVPASIHDSDQPLYFGAKKSSSGVLDTYFDGVIDNVSVWDRPKTGNEIWDDAKIEVGGWAKIVSMGDGGWLNLRNYTLGDKVWGLYLRDYKTFYTIGGYMAERHNNENMDAESSLKAHWKFNQPEWDGTSGEVIDSSTQNNNGTAKNGATTSVKGKFSNAGDFDGTDDYLEIPISSSLNITDGITLEAWIKPDTIPSNGRIVSKRYDATWDSPYIIYDLQIISASNAANMGITVGSTRYTVTSNTDSITAESWHYLVGTYDGETIKIYIDGQYQNQNTAPSGDIAVNNEPLTIGADNNGAGGYFDGLIDNVVIYSRAKSPAEIADGYAKRLPYSAGWGDFDHGYSSPPAPGDFNTLSLNNSGGCQMILTQWGPADWADSYTYYRCDNALEGGCGSVGSAHCTLIDYGEGDYEEYNYLGTCEEDECSWTDTVGLEPNTGYCYQIKAHNETDSTWIETSEMYPAPQWVSTTLCAPSFQEIDTSVCGQTTPLWNAVEGADGYNIYRSLTSDGCVHSPPLQLIWSDGTGCELVGHLGEGMDYDADDDGVNDLIAHWKMNETLWEGDNNEIRDSSGEKNHGRAYGGATTTADGWFDRAGDFDGLDDYVDVGKPPGEFDLADSFTVEAWISPVLDLSNRIIIGNAYEGSKGWHLRVTDENKIRFMLSEDEDNYKYVESSVLESGWHHFAAVWDGSEPSLYLDGEEDSNVVTLGTLTDISNNDKTYLGNISGQTLYFNGKIDNVAIYSAVKSTETLGVAEQIRIDYEAGACGEESGCGLFYVCHTAEVDDGYCGIKEGDSNYGTDTCCYTDQRIVPYVDYYYRVTAVSQTGESPPATCTEQSCPAGVSEPCCPWGRTVCFPAPEVGEE